jgi:glycosyltransferase involved in cell wall biosynthesis
LPILEAMACRTPVIGTPAGAAPDLLSQGGGIMVPMEDPHAMAQAIVDVCRMKEEEWKALSDRALETVTGYTWEDATDRFEAALRQVVTAEQR